MSKIVTDDFMRVDENPLVGPDGRTIWYTNGVNYKPKLYSNGARGTDPAAASMGRTPIESADQWVEAKIGTLDPSGMGICLSMQSAASTCYLLHWDQDTPTVVQIYKVVAANYTLLATLTSTPAVGDIMRFQKRGTTLEAFRNGMSLGAVTDTAIGLGDPGIWFGTGLLSLLTNYAAGPLAPPPIPGLPAVIYAGDTTVSGPGVPAFYVEVWKNGSAVTGPVLVDEFGKWSLTFGSGLTAGDTIKVRQTDGAGNWSPFSRTITAQTSVLKAPVILEGLYAANTHVVGYSRPNVSVEVFKGGTSQGSVSADERGMFRFIAGTGFTTGNEWTAKQTIGGVQTGASPKVTVLAAPANTDTYKTNIFDTLTTFDFVKDANDTDDIRRSVAALLDQAALLSSTTHEIKNAVAILFNTYAGRIAMRNG